MKTVSKILIFACFVLCLSSCAEKDKVYDGFLRGMYEGANHTQTMQREDPIPPAGEKTPTYDQYEQDRQEIIKNDKE
ncbi:MAG: hypothetical protein AB7S75_06720 [Desulfococcaceae bacterium]